VATEQVTPCDNAAVIASPTPKSTSSFVAIGLAVVGVVAAVGIGALVFLLVGPRGEKVGESSLTERGAPIRVEAQPGDSLVFRVDVRVTLPSITLLGDDQVERQVSAQLRKSTLTVRAIAPSGVERSASCAVSNGRASSTTITSSALARSGMLSDCVLVLDQSGAWSVSGAVAWAPELTVQSARLEARLEAARR
jgi:hypothetical protein